jgi:mannose-6-phosphate isomerase-like protein (cupin superfamily)
LTNNKGEILNPKIIKDQDLQQTPTPERCTIAENYSTPAVSIAKATVKPKTQTVTHHLKDVDEIYIITAGKGIVEVGALKPTEVGLGDVVVIPRGVSQRITNTEKADLVFYCVCTPRFTAECYVDEEAQRK